MRITSGLPAWSASPTRLCRSVVLGEASVESEVRQALDEIESRQLIARIWARDHTVWKPDPQEIANRLGWLTVPVFSEQQTPTLLALADHTRRLGIRDDSPQAERAKQGGILFAAGLITGEALMGIFIAIPIVMAGRADVLALGAGLQFGEPLGLAVVAALAYWLYRAGSRRPA